MLCWSLHALNLTSLAHAQRECNRVAHDLAHLAGHTPNTALWPARAPACVCHGPSHCRRL